MRDTRSPRILISRLSHIGDCILTLPVLNTLRAYFPGAFIGWVVESPSDQLLDLHPALDQVIVVKRGWMKSPGRVRELRRQLRSLSLDISVDPQSLTKSSFVSWLSGARRRVGFARGVGRELAPWLNNQLCHPETTHVVDRSLELLRTLGIRAPHVEFGIQEGPAAQAMIEQYIRTSHLACGFSVLNPGAGWASRRWPVSRFASVARHLGQKHSLPSVVAWAGDEERGWAEHIVTRAGGHALLAPKTSLKELAALLRAARLYVGSDTGPLHLAVAVGTTSVVLHGTTLPEASGAYGPGHIAVQAYYQSGSSRQRRNAENHAMRAIEIDMVCGACDRAIANQRAEGETFAA